jgi:hypothetical protein
MTIANHSIGGLDVQTLLEQSLSHFQAQRYAECLALLERLIPHGVSIRGPYFLTAACALKLRKLEKILPALEMELLQPECLAEARAFFADIRAQYESNPTLRDQLTGNSKYLVCGIPPHTGGTGKFLASLLPSAERAGFRPIFPVEGVFSESEQIRVASIRDSHVLVLHPQTLGFDCFQGLYNAGNKISMYVLDNSFFCIRSYNHRPSKRGECLDCVSNLSACHSSCQPTPMLVSREGNLDFLDWLHSVAHNIEFLCQTHHQAALLSAHFGGGLNCRVVGMKTNEFCDAPFANAQSARESQRFDVVLHAHVVAAKGIRYALDLAVQLPELSFLIPGDISEVQREAPGTRIPSNITMRPLAWKTGLREAVCACSLVLCTSEWSAPVEGALLKSLEFNGSVAVLETRYGFEREIPDHLILKLPLDAVRAAQQIRAHMTQQSQDSREAAKQWTRRYRERVDLSAIFGRGK